MPRQPYTRPANCHGRRGRYQRTPPSSDLPAQVTDTSWPIIGLKTVPQRTHACPRGTVRTSGPERLLLLSRLRANSQCPTMQQLHSATRGGGRPRTNRRPLSRRAEAQHSMCDRQLLKSSLMPPATRSKMPNLTLAMHQLRVSTASPLHRPRLPVRAYRERRARPKNRAIGKDALRPPPAHQPPGPRLGGSVIVGSPMTPELERALKRAARQKAAGRYTIWSSQPLSRASACCSISNSIADRGGPRY